MIRSIIESTGALRYTEARAQEAADLAIQARAGMPELRTGRRSSPSRSRGSPPLLSDIRQLRRARPHENIM